MKFIDLKIKKNYLEDIVSGLKTFEVRKDDRNYEVGNRLLLREYDEITGEYTGPSILVEVLYIHRGLGMMDGYVALALKMIKPTEIIIDYV